MSRGKRAKKAGSVKARKTAKSKRFALVEPRGQQNRPVAPPAPARELPAELLTAWAKLTEGLQTQARSKEEAAALLALLTAPLAGPPRKKKPPKRTDEPDFHTLTPRVQAAVLALDELAAQEVVLTAILKPTLAERVSNQARVPVSVRTLYKAETYRRKHPRTP